MSAMDDKWHDNKGKRTSPGALMLLLGWRNCDVCGYMGPRQRFEQKDGQGQRLLQCPLCKRDNRKVFLVS
jgi:hypothetical protein